MDVIIQEMIHGEKSGVLFQANPTGLVTEQVIEAGYGPGQGIVDDRTDTDRYLIEGTEIREALIREKERFLTFEEGALKEARVPPELQSVSVLTQSEIEALLTASTILSIHVDVFLDIEFTFRNGELYLLQARPITTLAPKSDTLIFDNSNIAENYPGVSLPLTYSSLSRGYTTNFKNLLRFVGLRNKDWQYLRPHLEALTGYWGGQIYYNLNNWYAVYTLLPFGADAAVKSFNDMVGIRDQSILKVPRRSLMKKMGLTVRLLPRLLSFAFRGGSYHREYSMRFRKLHRALVHGLGGLRFAQPPVRQRHLGHGLFAGAPGPCPRCCKRP
jgi:pyruvate,water dikinase